MTEPPLSDAGPGGAALRMYFYTDLVGTIVK